MLRFAVPAGAVTWAAVLGAWLVTRAVRGVSMDQGRTLATWSLLAIGLEVLCLVARPLRPLRVLLVLAMAGAAALVSTVPWSRHLFALALPSVTALGWVGLVVAFAVLLLPLLAAAGGAGMTRER